MTVKLYFMKSLKEKFHSVSFPLGKGFLKICSKFTGGHRCPPVNLLHIFRTPFPKNTTGRLLL